MRKLILTLGLCALVNAGMAQMVTQYDSIQDNRMKELNLQLHRFKNTHETGATFFFIGLVSTAIGSRINSNELMIGGGVSSLLGSFIMIIAPSQIGKQKRPEYHYNL